MAKIIPVILSGGSGTRLWPLSRKSRPKQFLPIINDLSLFQSTLLRLDTVEAEKAVVVCNESHRFLIAEQAKLINKNLHSIILEPIAKNTAGAIALAAQYLSQSGNDDDVLLVMPSDHLIADENAFSLSINTAYQAALKGNLVTFGITPIRPETGYGYIQAKKSQVEDIFIVAKFIEKPSLDSARRYFQEGYFYWNSGMFMFKVSSFLEELESFEPKIYSSCKKAISKATQDLDFCRIDKESFEKCPSNSIDYAVMEKTKKAVIVPLDAGWNDIGAWSAVWNSQSKDSYGNAGHGDYIFLDSSNNYVHSEHRLVSLLGVNNLIVIETSDAVLVANKDKSEEIKGVVNLLQEAKRPEADTHRRDYRPWGQFDLIDRGNNFQVKRITMKPHEKLSLQLHHQRAEHWIIVSGTARVQLGDEVMMLQENQSIYIPMGTRHSLENSTDKPLELIEVQTGAYLGEDDIVRFEDRYGRN